MTMYRYEFTGDIPEVFPALTGVRKAQGLSGEIAPGEIVETSEPVLSKKLVPADEHTIQATVALTETEPELTAAETAALGAEEAAPSRGGRRRPKPKDIETAALGAEEAASPQAGEEG